MNNMLFLGIIIGCILSEIIAGRKSVGRKQLLKSFIFQRKNSRIHIHHWMWCLPIAVILFLVNAPSIVIGLFLGGVIQGITYKDSFQLIYKNHA